MLRPEGAGLLAPDGPRIAGIWPRSVAANQNKGFCNVHDYDQQ